ncbi:MAG TPA: hypothetical protein DEA47_00535 [Peptococcaceae bacterium]|nr:MAG: hypothetical protein XD50_0420 [Clostridia bacterium 41_269]HBT19859.1 hypothetical protein [Peptococcaceae bacterium]
MDKILLNVAEMMALSAKTAPKTKGEDYIAIKILEGQEVKNLADKMEEYGTITGKPNYDRDARGVKKSSAVLLLALNKAQPAGLNCGACGYSRCDQLKLNTDGNEFDGPICAWRLVDLGIALGSAVKTASLFNADNRIMYRIGAVARREGIIEGEVIIGVPLAAAGKNIFFDR